MANLRQIEKMKFEKLFDMGGGYVLDFSNYSFQQFVLDILSIDIYDSRFDTYGTSKANRLRTFWQIESDYNVGYLMKEMLEYWKTIKDLSGQAITESDDKIFNDCLAIANNLLGVKADKEFTKSDFLKKEFEHVSLEKLGIDSAVMEVLDGRINEIKKCLESGASLSTIFMCGSVLEGILLGVAISNIKTFNQSSSAPLEKKTGKPRKIQDWTLSNLIDVAHETGFLGLDVKKYSHSMRDFRNYIHPYQQLSSGFSPDNDTAKISWQVLQAAISDLSK